MRWWFLCVASAVLLGLFHRLEQPFSVLGPVALVPWLLALDHSRTLAQVAGRTWLTVVLTVLLGFPWLATAGEVYGHLSSLTAWVLLALSAPLLQPQFFIAALARQLAGGASRSGRIAGIAAWVVTEQVVPKLLHDTLGHGLYPLRVLRPLAAVGTVAVLTVVVLASNEWVASVFHRGARRGWLAVAGALGVASLASLSPSLPAPATGESVTVAAVQASLPRYDTLLAEQGSEGLLEQVLQHHRALTLDARARGADFIVWGETVYPTTFGHPKSEAGAATDARVVSLVKEAGAPVLFGAYDSDGAQEFNAAVLLDRDGLQRDVYRKSQLFPFGEYLPFGEWWVRWGLVEGPTGWGAGSGPRVLTVLLANGRSLRVQPLICYEAVFGELVLKEAELLVNVTNDGGFGSTLEARQNLVVSAFRSIESGRPQLRVANSGTSALIDASGEVVASLGVGARGAMVGAVQLGGGHQPWAVWPLAVVALLGVGLSRSRWVVTRQRPNTNKASARMKVF